MRTITVLDYTATIYPPFAAGHVLNENEASQINQTWAEAIGNNTRSKVKVLLADDEFKALSPDEQQAAVSQLIENYAAEFEFGMAGKGGARVKVDPVAELMWTLAENEVAAKMVKAYAKLPVDAKGKPQKPTKAQIKAKTEEYLAIPAKAEAFRAKAAEILAASPADDEDPDFTFIVANPAPAEEATAAEAPAKVKHKKAA